MNQTLCLKWSVFKDIHVPSGHISGVKVPMESVENGKTREFSDKSQNESFRIAIKPGWMNSLFVTVNWIY